MVHLHRYAMLFFVLAVSVSCGANQNGKDAGTGGQGGNVLGGGDGGGTENNGTGGGSVGGGDGGGTENNGIGGGSVGGGDGGGTENNGTGGGSVGGGDGGGTGNNGTGGGGTSGPTSAIPYVFVIVMENQNADGLGGIYGSSRADYINKTLMVQHGYASDFQDALSSAVPSEPHYVWMEAGTNQFGDHTFTTDEAPSSANSTNDSSHLVTQLKNAGLKTWRSYQEGLNATTGACPIKADGFYDPKHDPFLFFQDVSGNPPDGASSDCIAHHREYTAASFHDDLINMDVAHYNFITPNLCNDMHGAFGCPNQCTPLTATTTCVSAGDAWLAQNVPPILDFVTAHGGVLFIVWDEPYALSNTMPFLVAGPHVKKGENKKTYTHSSFLKSLQRIFGVAVSSRVSSAEDFADFFEPGFFP